jgi:serine/threonine-protein kinase
LQAALGDELTSGSRFTPAVSPDGAQIVYTVKRGAKDLLAVRSLSESKAVVLPGTEGANLPFFSPDGRWIGFFAEDKLKKISARGGPAVLLCNAPTGRGASWGEDGAIVASFSFAGGLYKVPAAGGQSQILTKPADHGQISHRWPQILPGGKAVLFTAHTATADFDQAAIEALSLETGSRKTILRGGYFGRFLPSGHLLYMHDGMLFAAGFDPVRLELRGASLPILEDVLSYPGSGSAHFAYSPAGTFVYMNGSEPRLPYPIAWIDASGNAQPLQAPPALYETLRLSPDGKRLAVAANPAAGDLWIHDLNLGNPVRLTDTARNNHWPVWMPDGKHIIYSSLTGQGYAFWWRNSDGSGEPRQLRATHNEMHTYSISPDGKWLAYDERDPETRTDMWLLPLDASGADRPVAGQPHLLLRTPRSEGHPVFSPDGRWIAFVANDSGDGEVYVRPGLDAQGRPSAAAARWRISNGGGDFPVWSKTEKKLYFASRERYVMVAEYKVQGESFEAGPPRRWSAQPLSMGGALNFDLAPDGRRVLGFPAGEAPARPREALQMTFFFNFFDEVERRLQAAAPAGK